MFLCVCVYDWPRFSLEQERLFFALSQFANETLLMQTMTSKLYNLEDEWLLYWPLLSPDSILSKHRITTFFWSTEADRDKLTVQNGNIKHYLCIGSENKNLVFTAHSDCGLAKHQECWAIQYSSRLSIIHSVAWRGRWRSLHRVTFKLATVTQEKLCAKKDVLRKSFASRVNDLE